jgi:hypothetical protein
MATTDKGLMYEGAFGARDLGQGPAMTRDAVYGQFEHGIYEALNA